MEGIKFSECTVDYEVFRSERIDSCEAWTFFERLCHLEPWKSFGGLQGPRWTVMTCSDMMSADIMVGAGGEGLEFWRGKHFFKIHGTL